MDLPIWERKVVEGILRDVRKEILWPSLLDTVACICRNHWVNTFWLGHHIAGQLKTDVFCNTQHTIFHTKVTYKN